MSRLLHFSNFFFFFFFLHWGASLAGLKTNGTYEKALRDWDFNYKGCTHIFLIFWEQCRERRLKLPGVLASFFDLNPNRVPVLGPLILGHSCLGQGEWACLENRTNFDQTLPMDRAKTATMYTNVIYMHVCSLYKILLQNYIGVCSSFIREGNGNPLQYSCLENPVDRGALGCCP